VQNLNYTYDPAGNITHIQDDAQQTIYFSNHRVESSNDYTYDAVYRLIEATGREHLGQAGGPPIQHSYNDAGRTGIRNPGLGNGFYPSDGNAMGRYCEKPHDYVGNILEMSHHRSCPTFFVDLHLYNDEDSQLEPVRKNNRLTSTTIGRQPNSSSTNGDVYDPTATRLHAASQDMQWISKINYHDPAPAGECRGRRGKPAAGRAHF
jgi:hypothetical protein